MTYCGDIYYDEYCDYMNKNKIYYVILRAPRLKGAIISKGPGFPNSGQYDIEGFTRIKDNVERQLEGLKRKPVWYKENNSFKVELSLKDVDKIKTWNAFISKDIRDIVEIA